MSDLVTRLREDANDHREAWKEDDSGSLITAVLLEQAADRIEQLEQEAAANKQDAIRYRWLREHPVWTGFDSDFMPEHFDAAIDAALEWK